MKRFFVRCVGQFLCVFGLTSLVSDAANAACDSYSCSKSSSASSPWYIGWPAYDKAPKWSYITGMCVGGSDCKLNKSVSWGTGYDGKDRSFSTMQAGNHPMTRYASKFKSFLEMCALPTDGYHYPISGGYAFRAGCAIHGDNLYAVKETPFTTLGCQYVAGKDEIIASLESGNSSSSGYSGDSGSGSGSGYTPTPTPDCYYTQATSGTVFTNGGSSLEMIAIVPDVYRCDFYGCTAGCYHRYTNPATSIRYRHEPGAYIDGTHQDTIMTDIYVDAHDSSNQYDGCSTAGCYQTSHYTLYSNFYEFDNCSSCSTSYSPANIGNKVTTPAGSSSATLNWGTTAAGAGSTTCRLSSYHWSVNNGTYRVPCNNSAP